MSDIETTIEAPGYSLQPALTIGNVTDEPEWTAIWETERSENTWHLPYPAVLHAVLRLLPKYLFARGRRWVHDRRA